MDSDKTKEKIVVATGRATGSALEALEKFAEHVEVVAKKEENVIKSKILNLWHKIQTAINNFIDRVREEYHGK